MCKRTKHYKLQNESKDQALSQHIPEADQKWMSWLGKLVFCIERARKLQKMTVLATESPTLQGQILEASGASSETETLSRVKREVLSQAQGLRSSERSWLEQVHSIPSLQISLHLGRKYPYSRIEDATTYKQ